MNKDRQTMDVAEEARELGANGILNDPTAWEVIFAVEEIVGFRLDQQQRADALAEYAAGERAR